MKYKINIIEKIIGLIILVTIISKIKLLSFVFSDQTFTIAIVLIFFASAIIASIGMIKGKTWGYIASYIFIPLATYGLGISAIPFIISIVPTKFKTSAVITLSVILLIATITLHVYKTAAKKLNKS